MPLFFLNIRDGDRLVTDREGQTFSDAEAARREAVQAARDMLADMVRLGKEIDGQTIEITDESGSMVAKVVLVDELRIKRH